MNAMNLFWDYIRVLPQFILPQHTLSRLVYHITRCEWPPLKNLLIRSFIVCFKVDMSLARQSDINAYTHFNHFFTRNLTNSARPIAEGKHSIISPVDGTISQIGNLESGKLFQAKKRSYDLAALLADDKEAVKAFTDGSFATLYLAPRDYHRIHMPLDGTLLRMTYVPGRLFAVNTHTTRIVTRLFARNERVISIFDTDFGAMAIIMVGALNVGSMETVWAGQITPARKREISTLNYSDGQKIILKRGQEMGRFNMGSTVILLFGKNAITWLPQMHPDTPVVMGELLAVRPGNT